MKKLIQFLCGAVVVSFAFNGMAQFSDNFDSYTSEAQLDAVWIPNSTVNGGMGLNTAEFVSSPNSVKNMATSTATVNQARTPITAPDSSSFIFQFSFYDYNASGGSRDYGMLYDRAGGAWTGGLDQLVAIGKYNVGTYNSYHARVAIGSATHIYGNGAVSFGTGWVSLTAGPERSIGWHTATVVGSPDPVNTGKVLFSFFIDNVLGGTVANVNPASFEWIVLGSNLGSSGGFIAFDDVVLIPEPSTLALSLLGGLGIFWMVRRRSL